MACPQLQQFVDEYNHRMRKEDSSWEDVPIAALNENAKMAQGVEALWNEEALVFGKNRDIQAINALIHKSVRIIESNDVERTLNENEILDRFEAMGVNIENIRKKCEDFYQKEGFADLLKKAGTLAKKEEYQISLPTLTEAEMQQIEKAYAQGKIDTFFFYDGRVETMEVIEACDIKVGEEGREILEASHPQGGEKWGKSPIQFLAVKAHRDPRKKAPSKSFKESFKNGMEPINASQLMTLFTFLEQEDSLAHVQMFFQEGFEGDMSVGAAPLEVIVNEVLPTGDVVTISLVNYGNIHIKAINPDAKEPYCAPRSAYIFSTQTKGSINIA